MERNELLNKFADYIDLPADLETEDDAKAYFDKTFGRRDTIKTELRNDSSFVNELIGKKVGKLENKLRNFAKEMEAEGFNEWKDKIGDELFDVAIEKTKATIQAKQKELETKANSQAPAEFEKEKQAVIQERDFFKNQVTTLGQEFENYKVTIAETNRKNTLDKGREKLFSSITFAPEASELTIIGFKSKLEQEIQLDLDEQDNMILKDKKGNPIANPNKAGSFYSPEEYIKEQAIKEKVFKLNDKGGQKIIPPFQQQEQQQNNPPTRMVHPRAVV